MQLTRNWRPGDEYWALWIRDEDSHYFPMFEGHVVSVRNGILRLSTGSWRYGDEHLAFQSVQEARSFAVSHPIAPRLAPTQHRMYNVDAAAPTSELREPAGSLGTSRRAALGQP